MFSLRALGWSPLMMKYLNPMEVDDEIPKSYVGKYYNPRQFQPVFSGCAEQLPGYILFWSSLWPYKV